MTLTAGLVADILAAPLARSIAYGELLCKGTPANLFAHMPHPTMNHAAFNIGHLSLYPNRVFQFIDRADLVVEKPGFSDLFKAGTACVEQDGRYPDKEEIVSHYLERYRTILEALGDVPEEQWIKPTPVEGRLKELFPTVGRAANFLLNNHHMMHLGQVSAWRRALGLPSVM